MNIRKLLLVTISLTIFLFLVNNEKTSQIAQVYSKLVPIKVVFANETIQNSEKDNIVSDIETRIDNWLGTQIKVIFNGKESFISPRQMGLTKELLPESIKTSLISRVYTNIISGTPETKIDIDDSILYRSLHENFGDQITTKKLASLNFIPKTNKLELISEIDGIDFNLEKTKYSLENSAENLDTSPIVIESKLDASSIKAESFQNIISNINAETNNEPKLRFGNKYGDKLYEKLPVDWRSWLSLGDNGKINIDETRLTEFLETKVRNSIKSNVQNLEINLPEIPTTPSHVDLPVEMKRNDGYDLNIEKSISNIYEVINSGMFDGSVNLITSSLTGKVTLNGKELDLIGFGRSNFTSTSANRTLNVKLGLNDKFGAIYIPKDTEFKFNQMVGPISSSAGWREAMGIFGSELRPTMAGGLCQVATTIYRGALAAGLEITQRYPHSWWINYYDKYGNGLDSTVFASGPNGEWGKDLRFKNNTGNDIVMLSKTEHGNIAITEIYGTKTNQEVSFEGPFIYPFKELTDKGIEIPRVNKKTIYWLRTITRNDVLTTELIESTYVKGFYLTIKEQHKMVVEME